MKNANKANKASANKANVNKANKASAGKVQAGLIDATQETQAGQVKVRVLAENLEGETLDGAMKVTIKRHDLKSESKCAMVKRLLCTQGMTRDALVVAVESVHGELKESTLNTVRADLKRQRGALVCCTGWRTDGKLGKLATAAVAKLRGVTLGDGYASAGLVTVEVKAAEVKAEEKQA